MTLLIDDVISNVSILKDYSFVKKIEKGYSPDKKYIVTVRQNKYFLRLSDMKHHEKRKLEFSLLKELEKHDVQTHKAIEYTLLNDTNLSVMVLSFYSALFLLLVLNKVDHL
ncbi:hypothetical protein [Bacillus sp. JJ722]|uniref:hypothetical protein n=1 Tax=Bacillus sp. JJ722 TaxID=3122973 RepID=UPI002FFF2D6F